MPIEQNTGEGPIRVLVADNTHIHTQLLSDALRRDRRLEIVSSGPPLRGLVDAAAKHQVQVGIISCNLEGEPLRGLELVRELRGAMPEIQVVVLMDSAKREAVIDAFRAGARGIFSRTESLETLSKCVRAVHDGQIWASEEQVAFAVEALAASPSVRAVSANGLDLLSKREMEVVRCLADGLTNREIADRLGLSQHTIKNYLFRVFDKLGVSSRMELLFLTLMPPGSPHLGAAAKLAAGAVRNSQAADGRAAAYYKAAEEGAPTAQMELARMHCEGTAIARDPVAAYMWYLISERTSMDLRDEINTAKRKLADSLTADEILEAQKRAAEKLKKPADAAAASASGITPRRHNV
jgi:two-component system, NarL family, nitrate/nitrite response regulator NarL